MGEHFAVGFDNACLVIPISVAISVSVFPRVEVSPRAMLTEPSPAAHPGSGSCANRS